MWFGVGFLALNLRLGRTRLWLRASAGFVSSSHDESMLFRDSKSIPLKAVVQGLDIEHALKMGADPRKQLNILQEVLYFTGTRNSWFPF